MAEMKNICGKIPVELHEKVRAEIEEKETSTQIFIRQVIEEHFNRLEGKGEESMERRTLAVQVIIALHRGIIPESQMGSREGRHQTERFYHPHHRESGGRGRSQMAGVRAARRNRRNRQTGRSRIDQ